jgi:MoxR-like ATPase
MLATLRDPCCHQAFTDAALLSAIRRTEPTVLLVDEIDKADVEVEGLLLEVLSEFQVTVPEMGTVVAVRRPFALLTSNSTRELSEALKRRCLFLHLDFPDADLERRIVLSRVPELAEQLVDALVRTVRVLRGLELRKAPSVAETIDWGRTLLALGLPELDGAGRREGTRDGGAGDVGVVLDIE